MSLAISLHSCSKFCRITSASISVAGLPLAVKLGSPCLLQGKNAPARAAVICDCGCSCQLLAEWPAARAATTSSASPCRKNIWTHAYTVT